MFEIDVNQNIAYIEQSLNLGSCFNFDEYNRVLKLLQTKDKQNKIFSLHEEKVLNDSSRLNTPIYTYAPVVTKDKKGENTIVPLRYQLWPSFCNEDTRGTVNRYYIDKERLESEPATREIFGQKHGLILIKSFKSLTPIPEEFEYLKENNPRWRTTFKKSCKYLQTVKFLSKKREGQWVPCLWDSHTKDGKTVNSFCIVVMDAEGNVLNNGGDKAPVSLNDLEALNWIDARNRDRSEFKSLLKDEFEVVETMVVERSWPPFSKEEMKKFWVF